MFETIIVWSHSPRMSRDHEVLLGAECANLSSWLYSRRCSISFPANPANCLTLVSSGTTTSVWSMAICFSQVHKVERSVSSASAKRCTELLCPLLQTVSSAAASTKTCFSSVVVIARSGKSIWRAASGLWLTKPSSILESCLWTSPMTNKN